MPLSIRKPGAAQGSPGPSELQALRNLDSAKYDCRKTRAFTVVMPVEYVGGFASSDLIPILQAYPFARRRLPRPPGCARSSGLRPNPVFDKIAHVFNQERNQKYEVDINS